MGAEEAPRDVLFVCTSNAIRSPMAEGLLRRRFGPTLRVASAGVRPNPDVDMMAAFVMDEVGVDISGHRPQDLAAHEGDHFDLVISLSPEAHHHALALVPALADAAEYWPTLDPSLNEGSREQRLMEYREVRDGLDSRIARRFPRSPSG